MDYRERGQITNSPTDGEPCSALPGLRSVLMCEDEFYFTLFIGGDLSGFGVDLEQEDVVAVGELAVQAVAQTSVWSCGVVLVGCRHLDEGDIWRDKQNRSYAYITEKGWQE